MSSEKYVVDKAAHFYIMIATVMAGRVKLFTKDGGKELVSGDVVEIPEGTEYYWECLDGPVRLLAINSPPFEDSSRRV